MKKSVIAVITAVAAVIIVMGLILYTTLQGGGEGSLGRIVTVTVDGSKIYQEIEGFGGAGAYYEGYLRNLLEPNRTQAADLLFSDLGTSIYRLRVWTKIEENNDDEDPNHFNWEAFNFSTDQDQVWNAQEAKKRGVTKFVASVWSPPWWMKSNLDEKNGGSLVMYEEFAEWLAAYVIGYKVHHGIDIGWISIQNEPDLSTSYESCVYTPEQLKQVVKVVGAKFEREGISTKILVPEAMGVSQSLYYIPIIMSDPEAAKYVDVLATHLYDTSFSNPNEKISYLQTLARYGAQYNKPIWQTEYGYGEFELAGTYKEALYTANHIHNTLVYMNASAYILFELFWYRETGLISISQDGRSYLVTPKFYAVKQFFKFITPGSRRIEASANNPNILASSYLDQGSGKVTIVAINMAQTAINATFTLRNLTVSSFKQYRTSSSEKCLYVGDVTLSNNSFNITLPQESITTLISA